MIFTILICTFIICIFIYTQIRKNTEGLDNINVDIGNYICKYFYNYALSITEKRDFEFVIDEQVDFVKCLPKNIPFGIPEDLSLTLYS